MKTGKNILKAFQINRLNYNKIIEAISPRYSIGDAEYLSLSDVHPQSFDARYFGLITRDQIQHVVTPVFTWSPTLKEPAHE